MNVMISQNIYKEISTEARVIRCGCSVEQKAQKNWHAYLNQPCPNPRAIEDRGTILYWHKNPLRRLAHWLRSKYV